MFLFSTNYNTVVQFFVNVVLNNQKILLNLCYLVQITAAEAAAASTFWSIAVTQLRQPPPAASIGGNTLVGAVARVVSYRRQPGYVYMLSVIVEVGALRTPLCVVGVTVSDTNLVTEQKRANHKNVRVLRTASAGGPPCQLP